MFSARSAAIDAAVEAFIKYATFKARVTCAAFLAAGG
jgi:hypothetical protein